MKKTKWTPGLLTVSGTPDPRQFSIRSDLKASPPDADWYDVYVSFSGYFGSYGPRLFSAAPELYAALDLFVKQSGTAGDRRRVARAALAKARGEA